jgi:hypothetical protein
MIKQDKILKEAKLVEIELKKIIDSIYQMCDDLEKENDIKKSEIIYQAINNSIKDVQFLRRKHKEKMDEL